MANYINNRFNKIKYCTSCKCEIKPSINIYNYNLKKFKWICKKCCYLQSLKYEEMRKRARRKYYLKHKSEILEKSKIYQKKHRLRLNKYSREYNRKKSKVFLKEISQEDKQFIREKLISTTELYNKVIEKLNKETKSI